MKKISFRYFSLLVVLLLASCVSVSVKIPTDTCAGLKSVTQRFACYQSGINQQISSQIKSDYRDYISETKLSIDPSSSELFYRVTVKIVLLPNGRVGEVNFLEAGRNTFFDTMVERAIESAGPFFLPAEKRLQKMLSEFRYTIEVDNVP